MCSGGPLGHPARSPFGFVRPFLGLELQLEKPEHVRKYYVMKSSGANSPAVYKQGMSTKLIDHSACHGHNITDKAPQGEELQNARVVPAWWRHIMSVGGRVLCMYVHEQTNGQLRASKV